MINLIIVLVIIGVCLWLVETKIPMDDTIKVVIRVVVVLGVVIWLLNAFGIVGPDLPRLR